MTMKYFPGITAGCMLLMLACSSPQPKPKYTEPLTPEQAIGSFHLNKDFDIEIFAAEPYVMDPVDMAVDDQGNAYVVGMLDYPFPPEPGKEAGNIRVLLDMNNDGRVDSSVVFADQLSEATSILPWKGGLIVTAAPDILYLKDTTGDHKADVRKVLFTGFFKSNSEAQITSLRFGVDNWIYANNRGQAGEVSAPGDPNGSALHMQGADFRFRPDLEKYELETGPGQFGQTINDWGHRFFTENTLHIQQSVIPWRYTHRHNFLKSPRAILNISDHDPIMYQETPAPYWRAARTAARNRNYKEQGLDRVEYEDDHFTGCSGGTVYAGDAFPAQYHGNVFTGEVAGNLVHRDVVTMEKNSPVYTAKRDAVEKDKEFLSSVDPWFRPVGFTVGPDGYLYLIDYYRQHIETPVSIPDSLKTDMDFLRGNDMGRIYRIVPKNMKNQHKPFPKLGALSSAELVGMLAHKNQWYRLTAQRLLLERQNKSVIPALQQLFNTSSDPQARLHAMYALDGLNALNEATVKKAVQDPHPGVREHGIMLAERFASLLPLLTQSVHDSTARVALQATLSVGSAPAKQAMPALAAVMEEHGDDPWFRSAVLSSPAAITPEFVQTLVNRGTFFKTYTPAKGAFIEELAGVTAMHNVKGETGRLMQVLMSPSLQQESKWSVAGVKGLSRTIRSNAVKKPDAQLKKQLQELQPHAAPEAKDSLQHIIELLP